MGELLNQVYTVKDFGSKMYLDARNTEVYGSTWDVTANLGKCIKIFFFSFPSLNGHIIQNNTRGWSFEGRVFSAYFLPTQA